MINSNNIKVVKDELNKGLLELAEEGNPNLKKAAQRLLNKRQSPSFKSTDFKLRCIAFLTAKPEDLITSKEQFYEFCQQCRNNEELNTLSVIKSIVDRYTSLNFNIDCDTLTYLGIQLGKSGYNDEAVRCFERAGELLID